jgi:hypothetical protein
MGSKRVYQKPPQGTAVPLLETTDVFGAWLLWRGLSYAAPFALQPNNISRLKISVPLNAQ